MENLVKATFGVKAAATVSITIISWSPASPLSDSAVVS